MNNKALYIGLGVVALGGLAYFMMRKKGADATTSEGAETKSAELTDATKGTGIVPPSKGSALTKDRPAAPTCGCGTGQIPCPNQRCASKTQVAPTVAAPTAAASNTIDPLFSKFGITMNDFNKMEAKSTELKVEIMKERGAALGVGLLARKELRKRLKQFALLNNISYGGYREAKLAEAQLRNLASSSVSPQTDPETENFAFNLTF